MIKFISKYIYLFCFLSLISQDLSAQYSDSVSISVITCRPGDDIYTYWGHTAIRVKDHKLPKDHYYNYGMFSYEEPGFVMKFLRGKLLYWLGVQRGKGFINNYDLEKRSVIEHELMLNNQQKQIVLEALSENLKKENRKYLYDFFFDNCSTRPRDLILYNLNLSDTFKEESPYTFRQLINQYSYMYPWTDFGTDLIIGAIADKKASNYDQMFLPEYLFQNFEKLRSKHPKLIKAPQIILDHEDKVEARQKKRWFSPILCFGILALLEFLMLISISKFNSNFVRIYDRTYFTLFAIGGIIILFMWFGTDHIATKWNWNVLWMNPLYLFVTKGRNTLSKLLLLLLLISLPIGLSLQQFHFASILIIMISLFKLLRWLKPKDTDQKSNIHSHTAELS